MTRPRTTRTTLTAFVRVASLNLPSHEDKAGLLPVADRAPAAAVALLRFGVDVAALQEATNHALADFRDAGCSTHVAGWNNILRRKRIATAVVVDRDSAIKVGRTGRIRIPIRGRRRTPVLPVVGVRLKLDGRRRLGRRDFTVIAVHLPRAKTHRADNQRGLERVARRCARLIRRGHRLVVVGDFNRTDVGRILAEHGLVLATRNGVDCILAAGLTPTTATARRDGILGRISDHALITATFRLQVAS